MDTDGPLKLLFRNYASDLLIVTGDVGSVVHRAGPVELQALKRQVDTVLELERDGEVYYRHLEFQAEPDPEMPTRCFRYNTQLTLQYGAPVLTTVLYLFPPKPRRPPVFRVRLAGREVNRWRFGQVCLWQQEARDALALGAPGLIALTPLMRGGAAWPVLEEAVRRIEQAFPTERLPDAEDILLMLAGRYYTVSELSRMVGRDRMIQSSLYTEGHAEGHAAGQAAGRLDTARKLCSALVLKHHPAVFGRVGPIIDACQDVDQLSSWALAASDVTDDELVTRVTS